jgi:lipopolysaccharide biosynthesis regulator YciM
MVVEKMVDAEEVQEGEREKHDFLCEECGYQDDTDMQCCPMCALTAALDEQAEEEEAKSEEEG